MVQSNMEMIEALNIKESNQKQGHHNSGGYSVANYHRVHDDKGQYTCLTTATARQHATLCLLERLYFSGDAAAWHANTFSLLQLHSSFSVFSGYAPNNTQSSNANILSMQAAKKVPSVLKPPVPKTGFY